MSRRTRCQGVTAAAIVLAWLAATGTATRGQNKESRPGQGEALYRAHCASCHEGQAARAPARAAIAQMSQVNIRIALTSGNMRQEAATLNAR